MLTETDYRIRLEIYKAFADGVRPSAAILAPKVRLAQPVVYESLERLRTAKVVVLDQHTREIKAAMPFSIAETPFRVLAGEHTYFACSAWDAFGIALMINAEAAGRSPWRRPLRGAGVAVVGRHFLYLGDDPVLPIRRARADLVGANGNADR